MTRTHTITFLFLVAQTATLACEQARTEAEMEPLLEQRDAITTSKTFDVAENMARFSFRDAPLHDDGMPAYGNPFITQGYIYPDGFLEASSGTNPDGSPSDPEEVLGEWTCRGYMVGDGAHTKSGPMVITTQFWDFYDEPGYAKGKRSRGSVVTEGYENAETDVTWKRPITGGAGEYRGQSGQALQRFLGLNTSEGFNLRVEFKLDE